MPMKSKLEGEQALIVCSGKDCSGLTGGNSNDDGLEQIIELLG